MLKHPKGRAQRGRSVLKIMDVFTKLGKDRLKFKEFETQTGLSHQTIVNVLAELVDDKQLIRIVTEETPSNIYYMETITNLVQRTKTLETKYKTRVKNIIPLLDKPLGIQLSYHKQMIEKFGSRVEIENTKTLRKMKPVPLEQLNIGYYKVLNEEVNRLQLLMERWVNSEMPKTWEHCANCKNCKRVETHYGTKCLCTKEYHAGTRPIYDLEHFCEDFEFKLPKGSVQKYSVPKTQKNP